MEKLILVDKDGKQTEFTGAFLQIDKSLDVVEMADVSSKRVEHTGSGTVDISFRFVKSSFGG